MFQLDFLSMADNYKDRKIANDTINEVMIDTVEVNDNYEFPYETGVCSKFYNNNKWVIVEQYQTKEQAEIGHSKWLKQFTNKDKMPQTLKDVSTCGVAQLRNIFAKEKDLTFEKTNDY